MPDAVRALFLRTVEIGWDPDVGGFSYTLDWEDRLAQADRFWWPCAKGIGAAAVLAAIGPDPRFELWYRRIRDFTASYLADHEHGG